MAEVEKTLEDHVNEELYKGSTSDYLGEIDSSHDVCMVEDLGKAVFALIQYCEDVDGTTELGKLLVQVGVKTHALFSGIEGIIETAAQEEVTQFEDEIDSHFQKIAEEIGSRHNMPRERELEKWADWTRDQLKLKQDSGAQFAQPKRI